jgi:tetratricopeptide (TPR) repeat protein
MVLLSAAAADEAVNSVRSGDAAYDHGDYAKALDHYTRAEERLTDPGLAAFNKGAAHYRLGQYREAELHYLRCREDATGERLTRVLFHLGNAVVQQAQDRDAERLQQAIEYYEACIRRASRGTELAQDADFNLQLARALHARAKAARDQNPSDSANPGDNSKDKNSKTDVDSSGSEPQPGSLDAQGNVRGSAARANDRKRDPKAVSQQAPPGVGKLPPISEDDDATSLTSEDTAKYLEQAAARIAQERKEHKHRTAGPPSRTLLDW